MPLDKLRLFATLRRFDVRTARSKFVESSQDAIAFAAGRKVVLRAVAAPDAKVAAPTAPLANDDAVGAAYDALRATLPEEVRILAQEAVGRGTDITILGEATPEGVSSVEAIGAGHSARSQTVHGRRMLEHLEQRLAQLMAKERLRNVILNVRLHENTYTVTDATAEPWTAVHERERLAPGAHDSSAAGMKGHQARRRQEKPAGPLYDPARLGGNQAGRRT